MVTGGSCQCFRLNFLELTRDNQVARDSQLLDTAQDCFYFVTKFFEPISISATHIYHSALELCPISSIIRKLYYDRCHGITRHPRVKMGNPDSWDKTMSISSKHDYGSCTWSPCGQFIASRAEHMVEIRNHLTFELLTVLQFNKYPILTTDRLADFPDAPKDPPLSAGPLSYSPDGRSIACGFPGAIVIWDIQTGGVAKEIDCGRNVASLVWSLDGKTIAITFSYRGFTSDLQTYDVFSGARLFTKRVDSEANVYLCPYEKSFRLIVARSRFGNHTIELSISKIEPTLIEIESKFSIPTKGLRSKFPFKITFCPSTYHISFLGSTLHVFDLRTSHRLLENPGQFKSIQFSRDGSLFAAFHDHGLLVWKCTSGKYTLLGKSQLVNDGLQSCLQFSPTSSFILSQHNGILQVRRLSDLRIDSDTPYQTTAISRSGRRIATAHRDTTTVTIIDLHSRAPSQFIDAGFCVEELTITGNVLVVKGDGMAAGWLLTEEGTVDGVPDDQRACVSDGKWTKDAPLQFERTWWQLSVEGVVGVVRVGRYDQQPLCYHIETGEVLKFNPKPQCSRSTSPASGGLHHHFHRLPYLTILYPRRLAIFRRHNDRGIVGNRSRRGAQVLGTRRVEEILGS